MSDLNYEKMCKEQAAQTAMELYNMKLHDIIDCNAHSILRVPSGWVYTNQRGMCFVPFDNSFEPRGF